MLQLDSAKVKEHFIKGFGKGILLEEIHCPEMDKDSPLIRVNIDAFPRLEAGGKGLDGFNERGTIKKWKKK